MTKQDILKTAFRVWGRKVYLNTSLSDIAHELGVTKTALYRHFKNKQAILNAMYICFFDSFAAFIKPAYDTSIGTENKAEGLYLMMRAITEYYARNMDAFIFSLAQVYSNRKRGSMINELRSRNVDILNMPNLFAKEQTYPSFMQFIMVTITFKLACFHKQDHPGSEAPSEDEVRCSIDTLEAAVSSGLDLKRDKVERIDFDELERLAAREDP
jgi:AcrR family transcriptional regulator